MAPEVIRDERYDSSADVYSFGVLMYCVACGEEYPYRDRYLQPMQAAMGVAQHDLRPRLGKSLSSEMEKIITMCWAANPVNRPTMEVLLPMITSTQGRLRAVEDKKNEASNTGLYDWIWGAPSSKQTAEHTEGHQGN